MSGAAGGSLSAPSPPTLLRTALGIRVARRAGRLARGRRFTGGIERTIIGVVTVRCAVSVVIDPVFAGFRGREAAVVGAGIRGLIQLTDVIATYRSGRSRGEVQRALHALFRPAGHAPDINGKVVSEVIDRTAESPSEEIAYAGHTFRAIPAERIVGRGIPVRDREGRIIGPAARDILR